MNILKKLAIVGCFFCASAFVFTACEKIEKDTPHAIKKLIREKNRWVCYQVVEYEYNNEYIYSFWDPSVPADCETHSYDKNANRLWIAGGADGKGDGRMPKDFGEKAIFKRIIWTSKKAKEYLENNKN